MKRTFLILIAVWTIVLLTGCESTRKIKIDDNAHIIAYPSHLRGGYLIRTADNTYMILNEPAPDVAKEYSAQLELAAGVLNDIQDASAKMQYGSKVIALAQRSQTLQILRESLFRLSELVANGVIEPNDAKELYSRALRAVETIAVVEFAGTDLPQPVKAQYINTFYPEIKAGGITNELLKEKEEEEP